MLFSEMKKGQLLGVTFPEDAMPHLAGKTFGFRVIRTHADRFGETLYVQDVKKGPEEQTGFVNSKDPGSDWVYWKLIEPAV